MLIKKQVHWTDQLLSMLMIRFLIEAIIKLIEKLLAMLKHKQPDNPEPYFMYLPSLPPRQVGMDMSFGVSDAGVW